MLRYLSLPSWPLHDTRNLAATPRAASVRAKVVTLCWLKIWRPTQFFLDVRIRPRGPATGPPSLHGACRPAVLEGSFWLPLINLAFHHLVRLQRDAAMRVEGSWGRAPSNTVRSRIMRSMTGRSDTARSDETGCGITPDCMLRLHALSRFGQVVRYGQDSPFSSC